MSKEILHHLALHASQKCHYFLRKCLLHVPTQTTPTEPTVNRRLFPLAFLWPLIPCSDEMCLE